MIAFGEPGLAALTTVYPETPGIVPHGLSRHDLLTLDALARLAAELPQDSVEYNRADLPIGVDPTTVAANGLSPEETVRSIEENGSWMVLKRIEQHPAYAALLRQTLSGIATLVEGRTGKMLGLEGFIFVSSPDAVTPFHFDPEHNILLQIRGRKTMTVFPQDDAAIVDPQAHEAFHLGQHHRNLAWRDDFAAKGKAFALEPGQAIHVPVKAPHWVKNGDAVSISLSVTWRSEWSYAEADARAFNHLIRRTGLSPSPPRRWPATNAAKSVAYRALRKAGLAG